MLGLMSGTPRPGGSFQSTAKRLWILICTEEKVCTNRAHDGMGLGWERYMRYFQEEVIWGWLVVGSTIRIGSVGTGAVNLAIFCRGNFGLWENVPAVTFAISDI